MAYDSIILGSGLSGLTCGLLLARSGRRVLIVEQHHEPAPVVRGFRRRGIFFDSGFHYAGGAGADGPLRHLLQHLGLAERLELFPFDADGFDCLRILSSGEDFSLPTGMSKIRKNLAERFPTLQKEVGSFLDEIEGGWRNFPYLDLDREVSAGLLQSVHEQSLAERLEVFSTSPQLQSLLSMHSLLYGVAPKNASVTLNAQVSGSYFHSVHGIVGGGHKLIEVYLELLHQAGVRVRCHAEVAQVLAADDRVRGVRLADGETLFADEVVATCNPALLPSLLPPGVLRPAYRNRLTNLTQTPSALILFARCETPVRLLHRRNLFVLPRPGTVAVDLDCPLEERAMYLAGADQSAEAEGIKGIVAIVPTSAAEVAAWNNSELRRSEQYLDWKKLMTQRLLRHIMSSCPELGKIIPLDLATPLTLQDYARAPQGAIYGVGRVLGQYNPQPLTRLPGLFLSGQAVAGPGLLGAVVAGYYTCGTIMGHELLRGELRGCR